MRSVVLSGLFIVSAISMNAQKLSLTPQAGFENSRTSVNYNDLGSFAPLGGEFNPQVSLRLDYKFKQGFGPYIGASTSRSGVLYGFNDIENGMGSYVATKANMQLRMEAGYQYTTKPIFFNNAKQSTSTSKTKSSGKGSCGSYYYRSNCSRSYSSRSSHCQNKNTATKKAENKNKGGWIRLQPSMGIGYIAAPKTDIVTKTDGTLTAYEYRAGNWNTAFLTGMGFEFGRNNQRLLNVSINYFAGIGNMDKQTISSESGIKTNYATLESKASGWNMRIGIPFTLAEKKTTKQKNTNKANRATSCDRIRTEYKYRCRMQ
ncbi:MAG TPA: hypothetical protein VK492_12215 [Chitinophagaceae bacterium]|nr:hypothetical protein [Chitinophagaceae bacterium]